MGYYLFRNYLVGSFSSGQVSYWSTENHLNPQHKKLVYNKRGMLTKYAYQKAVDQFSLATKTGQIFFILKLNCTYPNKVVWCYILNAQTMGKTPESPFLRASLDICSV